MKTDGVRIEYIQNGLLFPQSDEHVAILNGSKEEFDLKGWRLVYQDMSTGETLYTHYFHKLNGSFAPGEHLCVISARGRNRFVEKGEEKEFPGCHWDLYTHDPLHRMNVAHVRVRLTDESGRVIDSMSVQRSREDAATSVFIGHGRDPQWRELKDHLQDQHGIKVIAYEMGPRAGLSVTRVLEKMLRESSFALLVLTGEDIHRDGESHARENVVHELGLFQGKLGFAKAIALVEQGVKEFSNILGINQIRFQKGKIRETFGDVVATIKREFPKLE